MNISYEVITSLKEFRVATSDWAGSIAVDVETFDKKGPEDRLLGIALAPQDSGKGPQAIYTPIQHYNKETKLFEWKCEKPLLEYLRLYLGFNELLGFNYTYDKEWIDQEFDLDTGWASDVRIMWHLASAPSGPRPYSLKDAQVDLLGWEAKGDVELSQNVKQYGGSLKEGDHYLADFSVMAKYASLDAFSTACVYNKISQFFNKNKYWEMLSRMMHYAWLLHQNTAQGILVDIEGLNKAHKRLNKVKEAAKARVYKELKNEIQDLEQAWADRRIAEYKRAYNKAWYASHPEKWERFNFNSDAHKRELLYDKLGIPVTNTTEGGKPSVDGKSIQRIQLPFVASYLKYEKANTLSSNFTGPYLNSIRDNRLHPGFNICGTVSYRLSGFKPYLLNAPFDERAIMKNLLCDPGYEGVHADLAAVEPTLTGHYSEDPTLLKVFREGLGDIYLDLALELFPQDYELQETYNPLLPVTATIKKTFEKQRKIAKKIQLAVQYTGTEHTVAKNLTDDGFPTSKEQARAYVNAYWRKFHAVKVFNYRIKALYREQGYLRNVAGRIIRIPENWPWDHKDLPNRFIQSGGHDVLVLWVIKIYEMCEAEGIEIRPILLDCHDSTSNQVPAAQVPHLKEIYQEALDKVNDELGLCVKVKAEIKTFHTLAGLKGDDV